MSIGVGYHGRSIINIGNFQLELELDLPSDQLPGGLLEMAAALGYAVSASSGWEFYEGPRPTQAKKDYNVLKYMND